MAKAAQREKEQSEGTNGPTASPAGGETTSGYFRRIFEENPKLLKSTSNSVVLQRWLDDHPGHTDVPQNVKNNLANIKSVLRKKLRRRKGGRKPGSVMATAESAPAKAEKPTNAAPPRKLESLEEQIDDCMTVAKNLDRAGLDSIIRLLRRARNEVVWMLGE